jgi:hypothetical protein
MGSLYVLKMSIFSPIIIIIAVIIATNQGWRYEIEGMESMAAASLSWKISTIGSHTRMIWSDAAFWCEGNGRARIVAPQE